MCPIRRGLFPGLVDANLRTVLLASGERHGDAEQPRGSLLLLQTASSWRKHREWRPQPQRRRSPNWVKAFAALRHCAADFPAGDLTPLASLPAAANGALPTPITSRHDSHEKERRRNGSPAPHDRLHGAVVWRRRCTGEAGSSVQENIRRFRWPLRTNVCSKFLLKFHKTVAIPGQLKFSHHQPIAQLGEWRCK